MTDYISTSIRIRTKKSPTIPRETALNPSPLSTAYRVQHKRISRSFDDIFNIDNETVFYTDRSDSLDENSFVETATACHSDDELNTGNVYNKSMVDNKITSESNLIIDRNFTTFVESNCDRLKLTSDDMGKRAINLRNKSTSEVGKLKGIVGTLETSPSYVSTSVDNIYENGQLFTMLSDKSLNMSAGELNGIVKVQYKPKKTKTVDEI